MAACNGHLSGIDLIPPSRPSVVFLGVNFIDLSVLQESGRDQNHKPASRLNFRSHPLLGFVHVCGIKSSCTRHIGLGCTSLEDTIL